MAKYSLEDIQPAYNVVLPNVTITNGRNKAARALNAQLNIKNRNEQAIKQAIAKVPKEKGLEGTYPEFALLSGGKFTGDIIGDALGGIAGKAISKAAPYIRRSVNVIRNLESPISKNLRGNALNKFDEVVLNLTNMKGTKQQVPKTIRDRINKQTVTRLQQQRPWINPNDIQRQVDKILDEGYTSYSDKVFKSQGMNTVGGFYRPYNGHIAINRDVATPTSLAHEVRHKIDYSIPLTENEERILNDAYGKDFINSFKSDKRLKDYKDIVEEMVTTNRDARDHLFNGASDWSVDQQNDFIDTVHDNFIIKAIGDSNGYGLHYIRDLRDNGRLTKEKIKAFREAMKNVGGILPFGIGLGATKFNNNNSK